MESPQTSKKVFQSKTNSNFYNPQLIEAKWQSILATKEIFRAKVDTTKQPFYCLEMFPYPSGKIHMGHVRNYSIGDVVARYKRLQGYNVMHPIGWDAFGLPAENAARLHETTPKQWIDKNIVEMRAQLNRLGFSYDWQTEVNTSSTDYYLWGQWFFVKMYEMGLVEKRLGTVNWDPVDKTVLANEQVIDGKGWRSGAVIEKKKIAQWFFNITRYAEELHTELDTLKATWPANVLEMQRNWIGRNEGLEIYFKHAEKDFPIFTTRPDTVFGVTYLVIAFDHVHLSHYIKNASNKQAIENFIAECHQVEQDSLYDKKGIFTGEYITNPFTDEKLPLYIGNFVLANYGTGAVMSVPSHDQRDFDFAKKYNLPIKPVIVANDNDVQTDFVHTTEVYTQDAGRLVSSGAFTGMSVQQAQLAISDYAEQKGFGKRRVTYKLKDWLISRQRYWGNPIPVLYDKEGNPTCLSESELPVCLPEDVLFSQGDTNPLLQRKDYIEVERNGKLFLRDTDTMDTFTCSSWYFLRYLDANNNKEPFSRQAFDYWGNVDFYVGGVEHACLHLLYARFFFKVARDLKLVQGNEPFNTLLTQGMVTNKTYYEKDADGKYHYYAPDEVEVHFDAVSNQNKATVKSSGEVVTIGRLEKMSKSKKNGVSPDQIIARYGADAVRLFVLFASPPEKDLEWNEGGVEGTYRFLSRVFRWMERLRQEPAMQSALHSNKQPPSQATEFTGSFLALRTKWHETIKKVSTALENKYQFNTAIASLMEFLNAVFHVSPTTPQEASFLAEVAHNFLILLSPFAPFITEELAERLNFSTANALLCQASWPTYQEAFLKKDEFELVIQVNGKVRAKMNVKQNTTPESVKELAKNNQSIKNYIDNKIIVKEIYISGKLLNLVVKS